MASTLAHRSIRSSIFQLPPELRSAALPTRPFSSTPARKLTLVDVAVAGPNAVINGIHALGIPWYATLPLTAVLVRGTLVYYFSALPARKRAQTQALLLPLISAETDRVFGNLRVEAKEIFERSESKSKGLFRLHLMLLRFKASNFAWRTTGKKFGAPRWSARSFLNFGMLIAFTEAIRLKCGAREGLLPLLISPFQWAAEKMNPEAFPSPPKKDAAELLAEKLEAARQQQETGVDAQMQVQATPESYSRANEILNGQDIGASTQIGTSAPSPLNGLEPTTAYFDPSMMTEGLAWFTDLTLPDSTFVFPVTLGLTMLASVLARPTIRNRALTPIPSNIGNKPQSQSEDTESASSKPVAGTDVISAVSNYWRHQPILQRFGVFLSGAFILAALKLPVAILLYFIPTIAIGMLQSRWLDVKYPIPQPLKGCARPIRMKQQRQWRDKR